MKMDIVLSTTCQTAMHAVLFDLAKKACQNPFLEHIVIVSETKTLEVERYLLEHVKNHAFTNIYIYSFNRLLKRLQPKRIFPLSKEAGVMIVRNIILNIASDLRCYKKTASSIGFAENIYETIAQLKSSQITPLELSLVSKNCKAGLKIKLEDIALIYDAYENYLSDNLIDPLDKLTMLEELSLKSEKIKNAHMYIVGFDSLTAKASSVIKSFVKRAKSVTASASYIHPSQKNAHIADNEVFEKLKSIAEDLNITYNPKVVHSTLSEDFEHIKNNLFAYPIKSKALKNGIHMFSSPSFDVEAKKVASLISSEILTGNARYKDCAVYLADQAAKEHVINAFNEFNIPHFVASPYEFKNHQLFVFIKLLFMLVRKNLEAEDVIKFARCYLTGCKAEHVDYFENYVLKYGVNHSSFTKPFKYDFEGVEIAESVRAKIISMVSEFYSFDIDNLSIKELCDNLTKFLQNNNIEQKLESLQNKEKDLNELRDSNATMQALDKAAEVINMLSQFLGNQKAKLDEFYTLLISGMSATDISLLPQGVDEVQIVTSSDGLLDIKNLYIVGASEGVFPKRAQDLGLINDGEIMALENINEKKIEPTIKTINRRERYKAFELLLLAKNKLTISFSEHQDNGEENKMCSIMQILSSMFYENNEPLKIPHIASPFVEEDSDGSHKLLALSLSNNAVATNYLADAVTKFKKGIDYKVDSSVIDSLYFALKENMTDETKHMFASLNSCKSFENINNASKLFFPKNTTSISQLEKYFACPFMHFASYGLNLKERQKASMRALDVGDILHEVAERFVKHYLTHSNFDQSVFAKNCLSSILENKKYSQEQNKTLINILKSEVVRLCTTLKEQLDNSRFVPVATEKWFGGDNQAIKLNDSLEIVGKIDRIDTCEDKSIVIDYKTGKIDAAPVDIYYGIKLQLAIYLSALKKDTYPAGVLYFPIRNDFAASKEKAKQSYQMKGFILKDNQTLLNMDTTLSLDNPKSKFIQAELKASKAHKANNVYEFKDSSLMLDQSELINIKEYALALAKKAAKEILEGYAKPSPFMHGGVLPCNYCSYKNVCGILTENLYSVRQPHVLNDDSFYKGGQNG